VNIEWLKFKLALAMLLALSLAVLPGCSLLRFGYGQLDLYAAWQADAYFDLDPEQKQEFRKRFDRLHEWHRHEQLPEYAGFLGATRGRVQKGLTRDDVLWVTEGVKARYRAIVKHSADDMAALLMTVTPAQLETLRREWERDNRRFVGEYRLDRSVEDQQRAHGRRVLARVRDWVGHLDDVQHRKILEWARAAPLIHGLRHQDRLRRQREFIQLMGERGDPQKFAARLRHWLADWEGGRDPEYGRLFDEWLRQQADLYAEIYRMLLPQQRAAVIARLEGYIDDLTRLARRPATHAAAGR